MLFDRNVTVVDETRALSDAVRAAVAERCGHVPFVATDQEGGRVARVRAGAQEIPPMMALGAVDDADLAERVGRLLGDDLRRAGITVDFAPVLDLALSSGNAVVGTRAFGDDPARVAALGIAVARGLAASGIIATYKHFPGHGASAEDSHEVLPVVDAAPALLRSRDVLPFRDAIAAGARAVMAAHVVVRALDAALPASLSPRIIGGVLRDELGFDGVCFTDCLEMNAIGGTVGTVRAAVQALIAGVDCPLISHTLDLAQAARDAIVAAVETGELPLERLEEAVARIARLSRASATTATTLDPHAGAEAAARAIGIVRSASPGPRLGADDLVTVVSFEGEARGAESRSAYPSLSLALRERRIRSELLRVPLEPTADEREQLVALMQAQPGRHIVLLVRGARRLAAQRAAIDALLAVAPGAIAVLMRDPFDAEAVAQASTIVCAYGDQQVCIDALADVLSGRAQAAGRLPVELALARA